jgi:hypothetical protein
MSLLDCIYYFLVLSLILQFFKIIFVKLILKIIDVSKLLNIDRVESFQLSFKSFILFLVLRLDILNTLESFLSSF